MPRTKYIKKTRKRSRGRDDRVQEFDSAVFRYLDECQEIKNSHIQQLTDGLNHIRSKIPARVINMTLEQLRNLRVNTVHEIRTPLTVSRESKTDDGYITGRSTRSKSRDTSCGSIPVKKMNSGRLLPSVVLSSIKPVHSVSKGTPAVPAHLTNRRRSRSAGSNGGLLMPRPGMKRMTPMNQRLSRSKFRDTNVDRMKAASADRYIITPKVQPGTPLAVMRHANVGESVFAITGSPVISSNMGEATANVNIPIGNGYLSLRPAQVDTISPSYLRKIDKSTIRDLQQLQENLNRLMKAAGVSDN